MGLKKDFILSLIFLTFIVGAFGIVSAATGITVTYPNGGEYVKDGVIITWSVTGSQTTDRFDVRYSPNNGVSWTTIVETLFYTTRSHEWDTSSAPDGSNYLIQVVESGSSPGAPDDVSNFVFIVDNTDPTSSAGPLSTYQNTATFNVLFSITDANPDSVELWYRKDGGSWTKYGTTFTSSPISFTASGDGVYQFYTIATDRAGNVESKSPTVEASTTVDTIVPTITDDYANDGVWVITSQTINLNPNDANGISVVRTCEGAGCTPSTVLSSPYQLSYTTNKNTIVRYQATDNAGNPSAIGEFNLKIDLDAPTVGVSGAPSGFIVSTAGATAGVTCTDSPSGCDASSYKFRFYDANPGVCSTDYATYTSVNPVTGHKWVCVAAKDNAGNTGFSSPVEFTIFNTIQSAIDAAADGDIINVAAGTYDEQITIDIDNLVIQSIDGAATTIIDVTDTGTSNGGVIFDGNGNTLDGFTVRDYSDESYENKIIRINSDNNIIQNNIIQGNLNQAVLDQTEYGILFQSTASGNLIDSNEVYDIGYIGINVAPDTGTSSNTIKNNNVHNIGFYAITIDRSPNNIVTQNTISDLVGGTLWGDYYDPAIWSWGVIVWGANSVGTVINDQDLIDLPNGISLSSTQGVTVQNSEIADNNIGIRLGARDWPADDSDNNVVQNNLVHDNAKGILIVDSVGANVLGPNNAINFNSIFDNPGGDTGLENEADVEIDAEQNWWGCGQGPGNIGCDSVSGIVDYIPFAEDNTFTRFYAPVLDSIGAKSVNEGSLLTITLSATDGDGDFLTFSDNAAFGTLTGNVFTWTPTGANQGANLVAFTVSDGDLTDSETITITVNNVAPVVNAGADQTVNEGALVSFSGTASDAGNDALTYSWNFGDSDTGTGQSTTHTYTDNGIYTVTLSVNDGTTTTTDTLTVTVNNVAPTITTASADKNEVAIEEIIAFTGIATDPAEDDTLTYEWNFGDSQISTDQNQTHSYSTGGIYTVTLTVTDDDGGSDVSDNIEITVHDLVWTLNDSEWNLVSVPKTLATKEKSILLPGNAVWSYNGSWVTPPTINPGVGYWVNNSPLTSKGLDYATQTPNQTLPSETIILKQGWNLIGHMCTSSQEVEVAFPSEVYHDLFVLRYDEESGQFQIYSTMGWIQEFWEMFPGEGYWVFVPSGDLAYTNIC